MCYIFHGANVVSLIWLSIASVDNEDIQLIVVVTHKSGHYMMLPKLVIRYCACIFTTEELICFLFSLSTVFLLSAE